jgi:pimeloyl-ACP methyl ester carboxylesterase
MSTYILVHGAMHGGWCWHKIVPRLEARGHRVVAPDLPGHGIDRTPPDALTLEGYIERICTEIDAAPEPVILVGHSLGGMTVTGAAEARPEKIRRLIYVTALIPKDGESALQITSADPDVKPNPAMERLFYEGTGGVDREVARSVFYAQCRDEDVALASSLLLPVGMAPVTTPLRVTERNWGRVPRRYIACTEDQALSIALQRRMAREADCERVVELGTDHSPFFSMPDALAEALLAD